MLRVRLLFLFVFAVSCCGALHAQYETDPKGVFCYQIRLKPAKVLLITQNLEFRAGRTEWLFRDRFEAEHPNPPDVGYAQRQFECVAAPAAKIKQTREEFIAKRQANRYDAAYPIENVKVETNGLLEKDFIFAAEDDAKALEKPMYYACVLFSTGYPAYVMPPFVSTEGEAQRLARAAKDTVPDRSMYASPDCEGHLNLSMTQAFVAAEKIRAEHLYEMPVVWKALIIDGSKTGRVESLPMVLPGLQISPEGKPVLAGERAAQKAPAAAEKLPPGKPLQYAYSIFVHKLLDDEKMHSKLCYTRVLTTAGPPGWGDARYEVTDKAIAYAKRRVKAFEDSCHTLTGWDLSNFSDPSVSATTVMWNLPGDVAGSGWADKLWHAAASDPENVLIELK